MIHATEWVTWISYIFETRGLGVVFKCLIDLWTLQEHAEQLRHRNGRYPTRSTARFVIPGESTEEDDEDEVSLTITMMIYPS